MAVIRNYSHSDKINALSWGAECLFNRLLFSIDTYANFWADARLIKSKCYPLKDDLRTSDIERWLEELSKSADESAENETSKGATALIRFYTAEGKRYLHLNGFRQNLRFMKRLVPAAPPEVEADVGVDVDTGVEGELPLRVPRSPKGVKKNILKEAVKKPLCLFRDSEYADINKFKEAFAEDPLYSKCDLNYYYQRVMNWSNSNENKNKRTDWKAVASNFMLGDAAEGKLRIPNPSNQPKSSIDIQYKGAEIEILATKKPGQVMYVSDGMLIVYSGGKNISLKPEEVRITIPPSNLAMGSSKQTVYR